MWMKEVDWIINCEDIFVYFKALVLLYAEDTVLFSHSQQDMQNTVEIFKVTMNRGNWL